MNKKNVLERQELGNIDDSVVFFRSFDVPTGATVLDIGTNVGSFPAALLAAGWKDVRGIDVAEDRIEQGKSKYPALSDKLIAYDGVSIPIEPDTIDAITMFNLIEHIRPQKMSQFLSEVFRVMKPGGILIQMTPNKPIDMVYETIRHGDLGWRIWHCSLQTPRSMKRLLQKHGFADVQFYKTDLTTDYYRGRAKQHLGILSGIVVWFLSKMPMFFYPTISVSCRKPY